MAKIFIEIDEELKQRLKVLASSKNETIKNIVTKLIERYVKK